MYKKGRGIKKSKKQQLVVKRPNISKNKWWTLRMQVTTNTLKLTEPPPHTHTHSQLWSITTLSERVSREHGRRHLLSEMWRSGPCHLLAHCLRTTEQLSVCVLMFACVCVSCWETYPTCEPTPNLTAAVPGSAVLAEHSYYTLNIHNSFIWSNLVRKKVCGIWKCIDRVMFKKSAEISCHPSPVAYCIYVWVLRGEAHCHYYLTRHRVQN